MTLVVGNTNNNPDNRMVKYNQAVVRLGLECQEKILELDRVAGKIFAVEQRHAEILGQIVKDESRLNDIKKEIADAVKLGELRSSELSKIEIEIGQRLAESKKKLIEVGKQLSVLYDKIEVGEKTLSGIEERIVAANVQLRDLNDEIVSKKSDVNLLNQHYVLFEEEINNLKKKRDESYEFFNKMAEKEQFLNRKEADLNKYEQRLKKQRQEVGNNNDMKFK